MMKRLASLLILLALLAGASVFGVSAEGAAPSRGQALLDLLADGLEAGTAGGDWLAVGMALDGRGEELSDYAAALALHAEGELPRGDRLRCAVVFAALGMEEDFVRQTVEDDSLDRVTEIIWRLVLAVDGNGEDMTDSLVSSLWELELRGGGYALAGEIPDPDVTAMAACALHLAGEDTAHLTELLSSLQCEDGHFISYGVKNAESAAQVVIALRVCGADPKSDPRFVKNGVSVYDAMLSFETEGGFSHTHGSPAGLHTSAQVALALLCDEALGDGIYSFSELEPVKPSEAAAPAEEGKGMGYKPYACAAVAAVALILTGTLALLRRLNRKNGIRIGGIAAAALLLIIFTTVETPAQFYAANPDPIREDSKTVTVSVTGAEGGILIEPTVYAVREGESQLELLVRVARYAGLRADADGGYVRGIGGLYEFDRGGSSGWTLLVNGRLVTSGAGAVRVGDGDVVEWRYVTEGFSYER